ncbi:MAG: hypothetical protein HY855_10875 [Burkholderiales bacterium]|nr:hypothetical protein [Burkholderiales bacterium]
MDTLPPSLVGLVGSALALAIAFAAWTTPDGRGSAPASMPSAPDRPLQALADVPGADEADAADPPRPLPTAAAAGAAPGAATPPLAADVLGRLVVDAGTVGVLEAWLLAAPADAAALAARRAAFGQALGARLPPLAVAQAVDLLRRYQAYREDERALRQRPGTEAADARERLDHLAALRRRHFDLATAQALFGLAEARARHGLDVAAVLADPRLSEAQQAQQILALRANLPAPLLAEESVAAFSLALERQVAQMRQDGAPEAEIHYLRQQYVEVEGEPSALEREQAQQAQRRQAWELRHAGYVRQREAVLGDDTLDAATRHQRLERLLNTQLPAAERATARQYLSR